MGECEGIHGWATVVLRGLSSDAVFIVSGSSVREDSTTSEAGRDQWPGLWVFVMLKPSEVLQFSCPCGRKSWCGNFSWVWVWPASHMHGQELQFGVQVWL